MNALLILSSLDEPITRGDVGMFFVTVFGLFALAIIGFAIAMAALGRF
jgi:hypothetical protein